MNPKIFLLLIIFSIKPMLGDFILQSSNTVIGKGKKNWGFVKPLASHCLVHAILSIIVIVSFLDLKFLWFIPVEFIIHFIIDRLKSGPRYGGKISQMEQPRIFWTFFGLDQFLHQLTYILFVFLVYTDLLNFHGLFFNMDIINNHKSNT